jgi:hypothetical protein
VGVAFGVSLKFSPPILSVPPIYSTPPLPPIIRCQSFLASPSDVLSMPPSASVFSQHAIGLISAVVILIVCFPCFCFGCFFRFLLFVPFIWLFFHFCPFIFLFLLVIKLYPLKVFSTREYICIWYRPLDYGYERYLGFRLEEDEYWLKDLCSQGREISVTYALDCVYLVQI